MMMKQRTLFILLTSFLIIIISTLFTIPVHADSAYDKAVSTAPQGINMSNGRFAMPVTAADGTVYNPGVSSKVLAPNSDGTSIVQIVNGGSQAGGIWGDPDKQNYISTDKKQTLSMWMVMTNYKDATNKGDGLAFVLQNDSRGTNAISSYRDSINVGETLGVWGSDVNPTTSDASTLSAQAIQNSWALEFDPFPNITKFSSNAETAYNQLMNSDPSSSFDDGDNGDTYSHIASGFPAQASTYNPVAISYKPTVFSSAKKAYYYTMNHSFPGSKGDDDLLVPDIMNTNNWIHLTITVDFPNKLITYHYNDKNLDGSPITSSKNIAGVVKLSDADVNGTGRFGKIKDNRLLYGFTGSTGTSAENGLVIFEQIPSFVESSNSFNFVDTSRNDKALTSAKDYAYSGDNLKLNYNLHYDDGNEDWDSIESTINLPQNVTYKADGDGNIGQLTVGSDTVKIPASDIKTTNGISTLTYTLPKSLSSTDPSATITIYGTANKVTSNTTVAAQHAKYVGTNSISDGYSPIFTIKQPDLNLTSTTDNPLKLKKNQDANIVGNVAYADTSKTVTNANMTVHTILNNGTEKTFSMSSSDPVGQLKATISKDDLLPDNTLQVYITDNNGGVSNELTFNITVAGGTVSISQYPINGYFKSVNGSTSKNQLLGRTGDWGLAVSDTRGSGNSWRLTANASKLVKTGTTTDFNGDVVFKSGGTINSIEGNDVQIASGTTLNDNSVTDINKQWSDSSGILLEASGDNSAGTYKGTIVWTLDDSM
ncbi:hypothetical protein [Companilactobacillus sp. HBUAS56275]|uniref:WxL domain-containing protein n=1 Tax=Candidatus Companilactobacillus pullicola TaxID=2838523 RepID=A0A9D1ZPW4_9LACO|nr:hypothetical protein [Candidatus Companilactobacillus pullicola]